MSPLRVVLDTNAPVSALLFADGRPVPLRQAWGEGLLVPLVGRNGLVEKAAAEAVWSPHFFTKK